MIQMPTFKRRKVIESGGSYLISLPKGWIDHKLRTGEIKRTVMKNNKGINKEIFFLDVTANDNIIIQPTKEVIISIQT